ncbi:MAG: cobalt ECF transporter T component CbiQ [Magnetococcales bacterium]|nr:cobalt ECF transporter T component CbiQ [Magnetococcales bacterium]
MSAVAPRVRLLCSLIFALLTIACSRLDILTSLLFFATMLAWFARLPVIGTIKKLLVMDGFIMILLVTLPFSTPGTHWFIFAGMEASQEGGRHSAQIILTANAIMLSFLALVASMNPSDIARSLGELGCSEKIVQLLLFTIRYIETLKREFQRLRRAMKARAFRPQSNLHTWRSYGYLTGMLLIRSLDRADRVLAAMKCRGFHGSFPATKTETGLTIADGLFMLWFSLFGLTILVWQWG